MNEDYLQGRKDERARIKTLLELDLLLLEQQTPKQLVQRAVEMIDNKPLELEEGCGCTSCSCS